MFLRDITRRANKGGNVHIIVTGRENIPKQDGFMYFPNHQGLYDVLAMLETSPAPFSVVAKKEVKLYEGVSFGPGECTAGDGGH